MTVQDMQHGQFYSLRMSSKAIYIVQFDKIRKNHVMALQGVNISSKYIVALKAIGNERDVVEIIPATQEQISYVTFCVEHKKFFPAKDIPYSQHSYEIF